METTKIVSFTFR